MAYKYKALDLPYSEKSEFNTYRGNYDIAQQNIDFSGLEDYIESDTVLNAHVLNRINDDIDVMQNHWDEDIIEDLHNKYNIFQTWIDNLASVAEVWTNDTSRIYYKNDVVITNPNDGAYYLCLKECNGSQALPSLTERSNTYWVAFYSKGDKGQPVFDLSYKGKFDWAQGMYYVDDIVYVINTYDVSFFACTQDIEYDVNIAPSEDEDHWLLLFKVDIPALKILDEQPIILKLYPSNLLYPSLVLFPTETKIVADGSFIITKSYPEDDLYPSLTLYPTETEIISEDENKFFGAKSTKLFNNTYLADFFDMYINEQADIQSKTSLTRIGLQSIAEWIQDFVDEYNL